MPLLNLDRLTPFQAVQFDVDGGRLPGPKIIPNCAMVRLNWQLADGKVAHNIAYAAWTGTPALSATLATTMFNAIFTGAAWAAMLPLLHPSASIQSLTLLDVRSITGVEFNSTGSAQPGTSTGTAMPDEVALCITLKTANRGQSGRGRLYIPGWAGNAMGSGGIAAAGTVTALTNWATNNLKAVIDSQLGSMSLGLPARQAYTSPVTGRQFPARNAQTVQVITATCRNNTWDTQRRRGLK